MSTVVEVSGLTKRYGDFTALNDVSFSLEEGKIYGLLGRNGAGKTTIMHLITAQLFATSGQVRVFGESPYENNRVLERICFIKESQRYPDSFCVADVMDIAAIMFPNWDKDYANKLLRLYQLPLKRHVKRLSRGMTSAVGVVIGLASRAPLTIFDEPYLGLDAVARSLFYDQLIEDFSNYPRTVVLSTHLIDEVSRMLEHVIVIDRGAILLNEDAEVLRGKAFSVAGAAAKVASFKQGKRVIAETPLGGMATATVLGDSNAAGRREAQELGLEIAPVSLQELVVHLTKMNGDSKGGVRA